MQHDLQCGFTTTVGTNDRNSTIQANIDIDIAQNLLARCVTKAGFVELQQWRGNLFLIGEPVGDGLVNMRKGTRWQ